MIERPVFSLAAYALAMCVHVSSAWIQSIIRSRVKSCLTNQHLPRPMSKARIPRKTSTAFSKLPHLTHAFNMQPYVTELARPRCSCQWISWKKNKTLKQNTSSGQNSRRSIRSNPQVKPKWHVTSVDSIHLRWAHHAPSSPPSHPTQPRLCPGLLPVHKFWPKYLGFSHLGPPGVDQLAKGNWWCSLYMTAKHGWSLRTSCLQKGFF